METFPAAITRRELLWAVSKALLTEVPESRRHRGWKGRRHYQDKLLCCSVGKSSSQVTGATIQPELITKVCSNHWMRMTCTVNTPPLGTTSWSRTGLGESKDFSTPFYLQVFLWQLTLNMVSTLSIGIVPRLSWLWGCPSTGTWHLLHEPPQLVTTNMLLVNKRLSLHRTSRRPTATRSPVCTEVLGGAL